MHWFLKQEGQVTGFLSAYWSGITTLQLAKVIYDIISKSNISGIHHITNNSKIMAKCSANFRKSYTNF